MNPLDRFEHDPRWVAWKNEPRPNHKPGDPLTKVPYSPSGRKAEADNPSTWGTKAQALACRLARPDGGGIGIELGDLGDALTLGGFDIDSCRGFDGVFADWAKPILQELEATYTEHSPSLTGAKSFFLVEATDVRWFLDLIRVSPEQWGCRRGIPGQDARNHGAAIEVYLERHYFTVTEKSLTDLPREVALFDRDKLSRLAKLVPAAGSVGASNGGAKDRSALAFGRAAAYLRAHRGVTYDEMVAVLRADPDPDIIAWIREKGEISGARQLKNIWKNAQNGHSDTSPHIRLPTLTTDILPKLSLTNWLMRNIEPRDFLLGQVFSTTCRMMIYAKSGLGKTSISLAMAIAMAGGPGRFLHWEIPRAARVLYIDGEMSEGLFKERLEDAVRRHGGVPEGFLHPFSREDFPDMPPLNTVEGQFFIDQVIELLGGVDAVMFDNVQALLTGNHREPEAWAPMLPWSRDLTHRHVGQCWIHHTGRDATHGYGDSTREWGLDTLAKLSPPEVIENEAPAEGDIVFDLEFDKHRLRTPKNRHDYDPVRITLNNDQWTSDRGGDRKKTKRTSPKAQAFLETLINVVDRGGLPRPESGRRLAVSRAIWQAEALHRGLLPEDDVENMRKMMSKYRFELLAANKISCNGEWVWPL